MLKMVLKGYKRNSLIAKYAENEPEEALIATAHGIALGRDRKNFAA